MIPLEDIAANPTFKETDMRPIMTLFVALLTTLLLSACKQESPPPRPETAKPAATETQPVSEEAKPPVAEPVTEAQKEAEKPAADAQAPATAVTEEARTPAAAAVQEAQQEVAPVTAAAPATVKPAAPAAEGPATVIYEATMGKVTFNHAVHSASLDCSKCHPTDPPQKVVIDKEIAHTLCKDCHKEAGGNAPTACTGCHKK